MAQKEREELKRIHPKSPDWWRWVDTLTDRQVVAILIQKRLGKVKK